MTPLLILHIALGTALVVVFIARYVAVLAKRIGPRTGRGAMTVLATALVASGVVVGIVYKAPITKACLSSLGIIVTVVVLEYALQILAPKQLPASK